MAGTAFTSSSALAQTYQRAGLILQAELRCLMLALCGEDPESVIVVEPSTGTKRGTREKIRFQPWNTAPMPKGRMSQVWGQEGSDSYLEDSLDIQYLVLSDRAIENEVSDQNEVEFSLMESSEIGLAHDAARVLEFSIMHQLAGYSPVNDLTAGGPNGTGYSHGTSTYIMSCGNACIEPDTAHHFFAPDSSGSNANEAAVAADSSSVVTDRFVNKCLRKLRSDRYGVTYPMMPAMTPWGKGYIYLDSTEGLEQVKENSSDSDIYDLARACIEGGMPPENSTLWTNEGFKIRDVFYLASDFITLGTTGGTPGDDTAGEFLANVQRGLLLGARAGHIRWGEKFSRNKWLGYSKETFHRRLSHLTDTVFGMNVTIPSTPPADRDASGNQRWASAVISHYSEVTTHPYS